jgi:hypothetical protein
MYISAYAHRGVPTIGVKVIAFVPPANVGRGRDMGSLFVMLFLLFTLIVQRRRC